MLDTEYKQILNEVLAENKYFCLATSDANGTPWSSPLLYIKDEDYNFYFLSHSGSRHCQNIKENNQVAFSIFDSKQNPGIAFGIQAYGKANIVEEIPLDIRESLLKQVSASITSRDYIFHKITIDEIFLPDEHRWEKDGNIRKSVKIR